MKSKSKWQSRLLQILGMLFLLIIGISFSVSWILVHPKNKPLESSPKNYGLSFENVNFSSSYDKTQLKGWWIPSGKSNKTIIFSHGYRGNRENKKSNSMELAKFFVENGYNVFMFDFRNSGESSGSITTLGALEKFDLLSAIDFAKLEKNSSHIDLIGWSMGSVTSILAGVKSDSIDHIIADSPFSNLRDYLNENLSHWSKLPSFPFNFIIMQIAPLMAGMDLEKVNTLDAVENLRDKKLLIIHSKKDEAISYKNSEKIYKHIKNHDNTKIWITNLAKHTQTYIHEKEEYQKRVLEFLNN